MDEWTDAEAVEGLVELILLEGLTRSVSAKVDHVCGDLVTIRHHLEEVTRLSEGILGQLRPPNPLHTNVETIHAQASAALALPVLSFLDY